MLQCYVRNMYTETRRQKTKRTYSKFSQKPYHNYDNIQPPLGEGTLTVFCFKTKMSKVPPKLPGSFKTVAIF